MNIRENVIMKNGEINEIVLVREDTRRKFCQKVVVWIECERDEERMKES